MAVNPRKLAIVLAIGGAVAAPLLTGSFNRAVADFHRTVENETRIYAVEAAASHSGKSLKAYFDSWTGSCRILAEQRCADVKAGELTGIWAVGACETPRETEQGCIKAYVDAHDASDPASRFHGTVRSLPTLWLIARDAALAGLVLGALTLAATPFWRWLKS